MALGWGLEVTTAGTYYDESTRMNGHLVTAASPSSVSTVVFTNLVSIETVVFYFDVLVDSNTSLYALFSQDNGASWANINHYQFVVAYANPGGYCWSGVINAPSVTIPMLSVGAGSVINGRLWFGNRGVAGQPHVYWHTTSVYSADGLNNTNMGSGHFNATNVNAVLFQVGTGLFIDGSIRMYRLTK